MSYIQINSQINSYFSWQLKNRKNKTLFFRENKDFVKIIVFFSEK